jgi:Cu+-exporting ATPase
LGYIGASDRLRDNAAEAIDRLKDLGIDSVMLTGDNPMTAGIIAGQAGITRFHAGLLPQEKLAAIHQAKEQGNTVGMIGDGINDAPALAAADVGFALGASTDVAMEAASIALMRNDLLSVADAVSLSKAAFVKIKQNLFFAFAYNVIGIPLAALGLLNPIIAAAAMAMSSLSVVLNALLLSRWKESP